MTLNSILSSGQSHYGEVIIKVKQGENKYWDLLRFTDKDTIFYRHISPSFKKLCIDSIPLGIYTVGIVSKFGDVFERQIEVSNKNVITFDLKNFYKVKKSSKTFIESLQIGDTLKILSYESGAYVPFFSSCRIFIRDSTYYLGNQTKLTEEELLNLKRIEQSGRQKKKKHIQGFRTKYTFVLNRELIEFSLDERSYFREIYSKN